MISLQNVSTNVDHQKFVRFLFKIADEDRRHLEEKINELTRTNEKYNKYISKHDHERRQRNRCSMKIENHDETKRKHNDEIHRLYDQVK